ncbi:MAG: hypothetical protein WAS07_11675 [Micropruina sp.]
MSSAPTQGQRPRHPRWLIAVAVGLAGLLAVFVVAPTVQTAVLHVQVAMEIPASLKAERTPADTAHAEWLERMVTALDTGQTRAHSATYDYCTHYTRKFSSGQSCRLQYVDLIELSSKNKAVETAIRKHKKSPGVGNIAAVDVPDYLEANGTSYSAAPDDTPFKVWATMPEASDARAAAQEAAQAALEPPEAPFGYRTFLDEEVHTPLDPTKQYLVIVDARFYFDKQMTCGIGGWPFCPSP